MKSIPANPLREVSDYEERAVAALNSPLGIRIRLCLLMFATTISSAAREFDLSMLKREEKAEKVRRES
jgi:hypothetical protein